MNILDHRILVPKSPQVAWEHLSDLSKNPTWQVNCSSLSFLTSRHTGTGVRWRYTTTNGREYVAETTAWYDGLGYEYTFVDGVQFRENKGRIRLQEIPEGTIVQWTFSYDMGGLLGGVRNAISYKRQVESVMVDSLKMLWRVLNQATDDGVRETKSILREGLTYEARIQYKPRHPSLKAEPPPTQPTVPPVIVEPPLSDDDTRPRAPVSVDPAMLESQPPVSQEQVADDAVVVFEPPSTLLPEIQLSDGEPIAADLIKPPAILSEQPVIVEIAPIQSPDSAQESALSEVVSVNPPARDTTEVSVFDVFGLPKPSETQEMRAVTIAESAPSSIQAVGPAPDKPPRIGLRLMLRRKHIRLRRPG